MQLWLSLNVILKYYDIQSVRAKFKWYFYYNTYKTYIYEVGAKFKHYFQIF